MYIEPEH